jgi:hypothetical protein
MPVLCADSIYLKSGRVLIGEIIDQNNVYIELRLPVGKTRIDLSEIESIERGKLPPGFLENENVPAAAPEKKPKDESLEITKKEAIAEKGEQKKGTCSISLNARYLEEEGKEMVDINGTTNLPDGALIYIFLKRLDSFISSCEASVKNGQFSLRLGPFDKHLMSGKYSVEGDFISYRQTEEVSLKVRSAFDSRPDDIVHAAIILNVNKGEDPQLSEERAKNEIVSLARELIRLREDLQREYAFSKGHFDLGRWNRWSRGWQSRLKTIEASIRKRSEEDTPLFPRAQENLKIAVQLLSGLYNANLMELKEPAKFEKVSKDPDARAGFQVMSKCFKEMLDGAIKEANSK